MDMARTYPSFFVAERLFYLRRSENKRPGGLTFPLLWRKLASDVYMTAEFLSVSSSVFKDRAAVAVFAPQYRKKRPFLSCAANPPCPPNNGHAAPMLDFLHFTDIASLLSPFQQLPQIMLTRRQPLPQRLPWPRPSGRGRTNMSAATVMTTVIATTRATRARRSCSGFYHAPHRVRA